MDRRDHQQPVSEAQDAQGTISDVPIVDTADPADQSPPPTVVGDLVIDPGAWRVTRQNDDVHLSPLEFRLLMCLAEHVGRVVTYEEIARALWQDESPQYGRDAVTNVLVRLRRRLGDLAARPRYIVSVPSIGYRLEAVPIADESTSAEGGEANG